VAESADTEVTPRLFTGQRYEGASGLYDFRARWYDAETGRFLSVDPIVEDVADPQTHNAYGYVRNNPMNLTDPDGFGVGKILLSVLKLIVTVVGAVLLFIPGLQGLGAALLFAVAAVNFAQNPSWQTGLGLALAALGTYGIVSGALGGTGVPLSSLAGAGADASSMSTGLLTVASQSLNQSAKELAKSRERSQTTPSPPTFFETILPNTLEGPREPSVDDQIAVLEDQLAQTEEELRTLDRKVDAINDEIESLAEKREALRDSRLSEGRTASRLLEATERIRRQDLEPLLRRREAAIRRRDTLRVAIDNMRP
jgi:RHS repeat-associated protein